MTICDPWIGVKNEEDGDVKITDPTKCTNMPIDLAQYAASDAQVSTVPFQHQFTPDDGKPGAVLLHHHPGQQASRPVPVHCRAENAQLKNSIPKFDASYQVPEGQPSAFTIVTPENRVILLAYGNQVFKAVP